MNFTDQTEQDAHELLTKIDNIQCIRGRYFTQIGGPGDVLEDWEREINQDGGKLVGANPFSALRHLHDDIKESLTYLTLDRDQEGAGVWDGDIGLTPDECRKALELASL